MARNDEARTLFPRRRDLAAPSCRLAPDERSGCAWTPVPSSAAPSRRCSSTCTTTTRWTNTLCAIDAMSEIEHGRHKDQHPSRPRYSPRSSIAVLYPPCFCMTPARVMATSRSKGRDARAACERLGLADDEVELVGVACAPPFAMSDFAQSATSAIRAPSRNSPRLSAMSSACGCCWCLQSPTSALWAPTFGTIERPVAARSLSPHGSRAPRRPLGRRGRARILLSRGPRPTSQARARG